MRKYLKEEAVTSFYGGQIRTAFRLNPNTLKYYLRELVKYGQLKINGGNRYRKGYEYELVGLDGLSEMRQGVRNIFSETLEKIVKNSG